MAIRPDSPFRVPPGWNLSGLISTTSRYMTRLPRSTYLICRFLAARCPIRLSYGRFQFQLYNSIDLLSTTALSSSTRLGHCANLPSSLFLFTLFKLLIHPQASCWSVSINRLKSGFQRKNINESGVRVESKRPLPSPEGPDNLQSSLHFPPVGEIPGGRGTGLPVPMSGGTGIGVGADRGVPGVGVIGTGVCVVVGAVPGGGTVVPGGVIGVVVWAEGCC
jgi:hypothetical protein